MIAMGALSDRLGRKPILLAATVLAFVSAVPLFWLMHQHRALQSSSSGSSASCCRSACSSAPSPP